MNVFYNPKLYNNITLKEIVSKKTIGIILKQGVQNVQK